MNNVPRVMFHGLCSTGYVPWVMFHGLCSRVMFYRLCSTDYVPRIMFHSGFLSGSGSSRSR